MRGSWLVLVVVSLLAPRAARAIQLHWSSGSTDLSFTEARRCSLIVQADSLEASFPAEWRLLWVADSSAVQFSPLDSSLACQADTLQGYAIEGPSTPEDSAANVITEHFCASQEDSRRLAAYLVDLPGDSHGKFKVVAVDAADSNSVLESNDATFNGGVDAQFPTALLQACTSYESSELVVRAVGFGLSNIQSAALVGQHGRWTLPLTLREGSNSSFAASVRVIPKVPRSTLKVYSSPFVATEQLEGLIVPPNMEWTPKMQEAFSDSERDSLHTLPYPRGRIQPKDFAFLYAGGRFHLFYIRLNMWDTTYSRHSSSDSTEKTLGHARSIDLAHWWTPGDYQLPRDTTVLQVRPTEWDNFHVWAPYIVQRDSFYMFYAGVTDTVVTTGGHSGHRHHQRIGLATSTDLDNWHRLPHPILRTEDIAWADQAGDPNDLYSHQLRDPFVTFNEQCGCWLMYFVARDSATGAMAVGVARSNGNFAAWAPDAAPLRSTDVVATNGHRNESPHLFARDTTWWLSFTTSSRDSVHGGPDRIPYGAVAFERTVGDPTQSDASAWTPMDSLYLYNHHNYSVPEADLNLAYWHASEYLKVASDEYLAAYDDWSMGIAVATMHWYSSTDFVLDSTLAVGVPDRRDSERGSARAIVVGCRPARSIARFRLELGTPAKVKLIVYDVLGRRVKALVERVLPAGSTGVEWDGHDREGCPVANGVYFVRFTYPSGNQVLKTVLLR